jgi:hypothetical protein
LSLLPIRTIQLKLPLSKLRFSGLFHQLPGTLNFKTMKKLIIYFSLFTLCLASCKKIISIDTENAAPQIVIEGGINDQLIDQQI